MSIAGYRRGKSCICQGGEVVVIIEDVEINKLHGWELDTKEALHIQRKLSKKILKSGKVTAPRFIAGVDVSVDRAGNMARAAVVVLDYPGLEPVEIKTAVASIEFPYIPGLLSFRESPLILEVFEKINCIPDLVILDGQGIAHPRRMGLACHIGLFIDIPTIGCAKSRLCGSHQMPDEEAGSYEELIDKDETVGVALRTKTRVKPVYVSIGHKTSLENAIHWVLKCCKGYRLPEPTRLAHLAAGGNLNLREKVS